MGNRPHFDYETALWNQDIEYVIGIDEVGRGAFAGPVVVGAVVFPKDFHRSHLRSQINGVRDSKVLNPATRARLAPQIRQHALNWGIGAVPADIIDKIGMSQALQMAAEQALARATANSQPQHHSMRGKLTTNNNLNCYHILTDINLVRRNLFSSNVTEIKHGDALCFSIAAASILAKTWRDEYMRRLAHNRHQPHLKIYRWHRNSGYGTWYHQQTIRLYGPTRYHRVSFLKNLQ